MKNLENPTFVNTDSSIKIVGPQGLTLTSANGTLTTKQLNFLKSNLANYLIYQTNIYTLVSSAAYLGVPTLTYQYVYKNTANAQGTHYYLSYIRVNSVNGSYSQSNDSFNSAVPLYQHNITLHYFARHTTNLYLYFPIVNNIADAFSNMVPVSNYLGTNKTMCTGIYSPNGNTSNFYPVFAISLNQGELLVDYIADKIPETWTLQTNGFTQISVSDKVNTVINY